MLFYKLLFKLHPSVSKVIEVVIQSLWILSPLQMLLMRTLVLIIPLSISLKNRVLLGGLLQKGHKLLVFLILRFFKPQIVLAYPNL